jgi:hypothetical protein
MSKITIYVRANRWVVRQAVMKLPAAARTGGALAGAMMTRCGLALLGRIRTAFIVKARGGTDDAGDKWPPLSPTTIAYRRRHPGVPRQSIRAAHRPSWMLTSKQNRRWWGLYRHGLAMFEGDKGQAARRAWFILKSEGAETLIGRYGNANVEILRDTGLLLNSLSPGVEKVSRHNIRSRHHQVFNIGPGEVIVGTNRKGALAHHKGIPGRLPQRRLWPDPAKWPSSWWLDITEQVQQGLVDLFIFLVGGRR